jgi:hypothetical protein
VPVNVKFKITHGALGWLAATLLFGLEASEATEQWRMLLHAAATGLGALNVVAACTYSKPFRP